MSKGEQNGNTVLIYFYVSFGTDLSIYRISPEIGPGLILRERPLTTNKFDHIYKTMVLSVGTWSYVWDKYQYSLCIENAQFKYFYDTS